MDTKVTKDHRHEDRSELVTRQNLEHLQNVSVPQPFSTFTDFLKMLFKIQCQLIQPDSQAEISCHTTPPGDDSKEKLYRSSS